MSDEYWVMSTRDEDERHDSGFKIDEETWVPDLDEGRLLLSYCYIELFIFLAQVNIITMRTNPKPNNLIVLLDSHSSVISGYA